MATWDGSYSEDPNYFAYSDQDASSVAERNNWSHFARNIVYPQEVSAESYYSDTSGQRIYEQSRSTAALQQVSAQQLPMTSNILPLENTYQEQILPNTIHMDNVQVSNNLQHSISNDSHNMPFHYNYKPRYKTNRGTGKHMQLSKSTSVNSIAVENSNLHPTASEFVPNNVKFQKDRFYKKNDRSGATERSTNMQSFRSKSFANTLPNNKYKNEKYYDNRKGVNYKQKNTQASSSFNYRVNHNVYNSRNNKFQNSKYYNRKHQSNVFSTEEHVFGRTFQPTAEPSISSKFDNPEIQENDSSTTGTRREMSTDEDYSQNVPLKNDSQRNSNKFNRFTSYANTSNYHKYNLDDVQSEPGARYKTAKYIQKGNNEASNHKEKKLKNWRDKVDNTKAYVQEKNLKKTGEIGMFLLKKKKINCKLN